MKYTGKIYGKKGKKYFELEKDPTDKKAVLNDFVEKLTQPDIDKLKIGLREDVVKNYLDNL